MNLKHDIFREFFVDTLTCTHFSLTLVQCVIINYFLFLKYDNITVASVGIPLLISEYNIEHVLNVFFFIRSNDILL